MIERKMVTMCQILPGVKKSDQVVVDDCHKERQG